MGSGMDEQAMVFDDFILFFVFLHQFLFQKFLGMGIVYDFYDILLLLSHFGENTFAMDPRRKTISFQKVVFIIGGTGLYGFFKFIFRKLFQFIFFGKQH